MKLKEYVEKKVKRNKYSNQKDYESEKIRLYKTIRLLNIVCPVCNEILIDNRSQTPNQLAITEAVICPSCQTVIFIKCKIEYYETYYKKDNLRIW
jgi:hypothetical protein